jgi:lipopolysaccharide/colanic/teichoic acid biosynthesis glycosyltransferase
VNRGKSDPGLSTPSSPITTVAPRAVYLGIRRGFDILAGGIGLLLLAPLFLVVGLILRFTGDREVFYFQERIGWRNRPFHIWKFSSMRKNSLQTGSKTVTLRNDPRVTPLGRFLRLTKINELPQIINVFLGDMTLVGARPLLPSSFKKYTAEVQSRIYATRPGITGIGSLIFRDEEQLISEVAAQGGEPLEYYQQYIYPYKGLVEMWYQKHLGPLTDLKILFLTFWKIVFSRSELVWSAFPDLPSRPRELTVAGIRQLGLSKGSRGGKAETSRGQDQVA